MGVRQDVGVTKTEGEKRDGERGRGRERERGREVGRGEGRQDENTIVGWGFVWNTI